jgi:hypothetical protein
MEFNMHFLGIETADEGKDLTLPLVHYFYQNVDLNINFSNPPQTPFYEWGARGDF